ncbi:conserved hypothetical protein [Theileria equi strain WA]|uniref:Poly(A) RNA polymerase mitochondrial-like central palm domain-containing protein n=1 Tax=Theileria equi strain WA TaxID=1537102 RepID=L1LBD2_THEEQ|nr:conserved hypothetical protein [Theileria equi strain WA]EKX72580.1 conserved hypothetical protein [Theileria equi strain WA]|eukprot:XP_004832032.1 conserved hypothetical protein [Theileria equi strain WA]
MEPGVAFKKMLTGLRRGERVFLQNVPSRAIKPHLGTLRTPLRNITPQNEVPREKVEDADDDKSDDSISHFAGIHKRFNFDRRRNSTITIPSSSPTTVLRSMDRAIKNRTNTLSTDSSHDDLIFHLRNFNEIYAKTTHKFDLLKTIVNNDKNDEIIFTIDFYNLLLSIWASIGQLNKNDKIMYHNLCKSISKKVWSLLPKRGIGVSHSIYLSYFLLDLELLDENKLVPPGEQFERMNFLIANLKPLLERSVGGTMHTFGSCSNGLWVRGSDIDFCLVIPDCKTKRQWLSKLMLVKSSLLNTDYISKIQIIQARVPIAKLFDNNGVNVCDVSINNTVALNNSLYVTTMTSLDARVAKLGRFIKYWAKCRQINNRAEGTMSSYTLSLQLFYFLANRNPPILPLFKDITRNYSPFEDLDNQLCFISDTAEIMERCKYLGKNQESLSELVFAFFNYYGSEKFKGGDSGITINLYDNQVAENDSGVLEMRCPITGKNVNPFTVVIWQSIHDEFRRFKDMLSLKQPIEVICCEIQRSVLKSQAIARKKNANTMAKILLNAKQL